MAILRSLNEFGRESTVLALEPARECIAGCSYCFFALSSRVQYAGRKKDLSDPGTFESTVEKAFGPSYDETHFLQWALRNRLVLGYANTVEPFQNVPQAKGLLSTLDALSIPLFIQTKGINFFDVFDHLKPFHDNATLFVSFPTENDRALKRFEPGTPRAAERIEVIKAAAQAGFHVILALSPYHEDWNDDPAGMITRAKEWGVSSVFYDQLHLTRRQREAATDPVMVGLATKTESSEFSERGLAHFGLVYRVCDELDLPFYASGFLGTVYGYFNTLATINPRGVIKRGFQWPYHDGTLFFNLHDEFYDEEDGITPESRDFDDSILVEWRDILSLMEIESSVDQPFSWSSMRDLLSVKTLPPTWQSLLQPAAPISEYYRAFWNDPSRNQFAWRHPWAKIAVRPNGMPWTDEQGNLIMLFDPDYVSPGKQRVVDDLSVFRRFIEEGESVDA